MTSPNDTTTSPPSDLNIDDESPVVAATSPVVSATATPADAAAKKPPGSPHKALDDNDDDDDDLEVHPAMPAVASPVVVVAAATTPTATTTSPAILSPVVSPTATPAPTVAPTPTPTAPASEREAKLAILTEAFPTVEKEVCEFVLESHRGNLDASINALLEISDPDFQPEPQAAAPPVTEAPPPLPQRQSPDMLSQGVADMSLGQNQPRAEIDPILLASTSTSEQQLRADEDFARTLAAMDEYRARDRQNVRNQQGQQGQHQQDEEEDEPSFAAEFKELMDEELPKIKERFNVAADTTKKKVTGWYNQFKANRAEAAQRNAEQNQQQQNEGYSGQSNDRWANDDRSGEPIRFGSRTEEDEPLARHRVSPPLSGGATPPLPVRPYDMDTTTTAMTPSETLLTSNSRRTTLEDGNV
ncbi:hypothetical protein BGZ99_009480 [Dissophora globulifera]|uniref:CUE domain-containing protein n=1 Tax=Dissophora globulifera TaxID=979702 RepID=A0A9P6UND2_9FUNG|nr:hypothetical protein BGZ99_009480 [Dissophora globulifera]